MLEMQLVWPARTASSQRNPHCCSPYASDVACWTAACQSLTTIKMSEYVGVPLSVFFIWQICLSSCCGYNLFSGKMLGRQAAQDSGWVSAAADGMGVPSPNTAQQKSNLL
jgi:hypothetical protein